MAVLKSVNAEKVGTWLTFGKEMKTLRRIIRIAAIAVAISLILNIGSAFIFSDIVFIGKPIVSKIGDPEDRVDVFVSDGHKDQYYYVQFEVCSVIKREYKDSRAGFRLHSPALSFGIRNENYSHKMFVIFMKTIVLPDKETALFLHKQIRIK